MDTVFEQVEADQLVVVSGIRVWSLCIPSKQLVNAVEGAKQAQTVRVGEKLWTLVDGEVKQTTVTKITNHKTREVVQVVTEQGTFLCTPDHPFATPEGWVEAKDLKGKQVEWTAPRQLCRQRFTPTPNYWFGYAVGAVTSDGTVADRYISLVVNELAFAQRFAYSLEEAFGIEANIESVSRPSGFKGQDLPGYRVRVVSSYLADLFRQYVGGDAHHMRQSFPYIVTQNEEILQGFIDGYVEGDGFRRKGRNGNVVVSGNVPFLQQFADVVGARFTPSSGTTSRLYIADSWREKHGFAQEDHRTTLDESTWVNVLDVVDRTATGNKPYTVYSFTCEPYPTFLVGGHLSHNCEHHMLPFWCDLSIGYIANGEVLGLSKFGRIAHQFAHRLQIQERLVQQVADEVQRITQSPDVAVLASGVHLCMVMRGIKTPAAMTSSIMRGCFRQEASARQEFLNLIQTSRHGGTYG